MRDKDPSAVFGKIGRFPIQYRNRLKRFPLQTFLEVRPNHMGCNNRCNNRTKVPYQPKKWCLEYFVAHLGQTKASIVRRCTQWLFTVSIEGREVRIGSGEKTTKSNNHTMQHQ